MIGSRALDFFVANTPPIGTIARLGPPLLVWSALCLRFAGYLKRSRGWRTGYSRKTFHFLTFATAAALQFSPSFGLPIVCLFGGATSLVVLYAILRGDGHPMYEAIAREKDAPHRTWYVVVPYVATLLGGLTLNLWFARTAIIGYLTCGVGDAVGEPVGVRFGRHRYRVPLPGRVTSERSIEGSIGVFVASTLAAAAGGLTIDGVEFGPAFVAIAVLLGAASALLEAVSPHGWDNAVMMVAPAALARAWW